VRGIFESQAEPAGRLPAVLRTVAQGTRYFGEGVRWARQHREESGLGVIAELTTTEQVALALLASARGPRETAGLLAMAEDGLRDVVRRLHARLGVQDQAQLISAALRLGFVRAAPHGLAAVGLPLLCNARLTRHHNPAPCSG
jgi:DNA-binding NarL/FixJ family response regulator